MKRFHQSFIESLTAQRLESELDTPECAQAFKQACCDLVGALAEPKALDAAVQSCVSNTRAFERAQPYFVDALAAVAAPKQDQAPDLSQLGTGARIQSAEALARSVGYDDEQIDALWLLAFHHCQIKAESLWGGQEYRIDRIGELNAAFGLSKRLSWALCERAASLKIASGASSYTVSARVNYTVEVMSSGAWAMGLKEQEREGAGDALGFLSDSQVRLASSLMAIAKAAADSPKRLGRSTERAQFLINESGWGVALEKTHLERSVGQAPISVKRRAP